MIPDRTQTLRVRTPEGVVFGFLIASPVSRMAAWAIDFISVNIAWTVVSTLLYFVAMLSVDLMMAVQFWGYFAVMLGYPIATEWLWQGRTLGKRILRLRVVDERGLRLTFAQVLVRNLLRAIDVLPACYLVGGLSALASARGQRLGDLAGATIVVREPEILAPDWAALGAVRYNSLRDHPHVAARLRQTLTPAEVRVAVLALVRRPELDAEARVALFAEIAAHVRAEVALPPEAVEGITDEQLVRNVVDVIFHRARPEPAAAGAAA